MGEYNFISVFIPELKNTFCAGLGLDSRCLILLKVLQ